MRGNALAELFPVYVVPSQGVVGATDALRQDSAILLFARLLVSFDPGINRKVFEFQFLGAEYFNIFAAVKLHSIADYALNHFWISFYGSIVCADSIFNLPLSDGIKCPSPDKTFRYKLRLCYRSTANGTRNNRHGEK